MGLKRTKNCNRATEPNTWKTRFTHLQLHNQRLEMRAHSKHQGVSPRKNGVDPGDEGWRGSADERAGVEWDRECRGFFYRGPRVVADRGRVATPSLQRTQRGGVDTRPTATGDISTGEIFFRGSNEHERQVAEKLESMLRAARRGGRRGLSWVLALLRRAFGPAHYTMNKQGGLLRTIYLVD
jgi:hypothetical protein